MGVSIKREFDIAASRSDDRVRPTGPLAERALVEGKLNLVL
jgi:hypothetical protein